MSNVLFLKIGMTQDEVSRVKLELVPMIQEVLTKWHIIHFFSTTPSESPLLEDFSSQLSSLQLDGNIDRRSWNEKLGRSEFTLSFILLLRGHSGPSFGHLPDPSSLSNSVQEFASWIIWGRTGAEPSVFFSHSIGLALILLRHGQYDAVEYVLSLVDTYSRKEKICQSLQSDGGEWSTMKERKISEAVQCFLELRLWKELPRLCKVCQMKQDGYTLVSFLQYLHLRKGVVVCFVWEALEVATEPDYRFDLAIQLGKLDIEKAGAANLMILQW